MNSPEDGPVGPKHVEIRQYINKIEIVTYLCVHFIQIINGNIGYNIAVEAVLWKNYENMSLYRFYCMKICGKAHNVEVLQHWHIQTRYMILCFP